MTAVIGCSQCLIRSDGRQRASTGHQRRGQLLAITTVAAALARILPCLSCIRDRCGCRSGQISCGKGRDPRGRSSVCIHSRQRISVLHHDKAHQGKNKKTLQHSDRHACLGRSSIFGAATYCAQGNSHGPCGELPQVHYGWKRGAVRPSRRDAGEKPPAEIPVGRQSAVTLCRHRGERTEPMRGLPALPHSRPGYRHGSFA